MCKSAGIIHEFLPASEILRVAEAVLRVFKQLGDYEHKQRNRMKFMIKTLGWDRWTAEYDRELAACRGRGRCRSLEIDPPAVEAAPAWTRDEAPSPSLIASRVAAVAADRARASRRRSSRSIMPGDEAYARWRATNVRPQKQFGYVIATATVPLGDLTSEQMRVIGELARRLQRRHGAGDDGSEPGVPLGAASATCASCIGGCRPPASGLAEASTMADVASCPGAESCRLAVTQSRGLGRLLEDHLRARPDLIAAADGARIKISGCPNGCGQHHIATIGFQGSVRRLGAKAVPQYFVMVGGGTTEHGASFARTAAKIPARRIPEAVERLIAFYQRERQDGRVGAGVLPARRPARASPASSHDLQRLTAADAVPLDFVDLAETAEFAPEVMEGECSA